MAVIAVNGATVNSNFVIETPRLNSGDELLSSIVNECFDSEMMPCLKGKVLTYLDTQLNIEEQYGRSFGKADTDEKIYDRVARLLNTREFRVQLPETFFDNAALTFRSDRGIDIDLPNEVAEEARGDLLKKKLLLPVLLLLKLKMKALMPIFVALIGLKAMKALILSKLAIGIVLGFVAYQLFSKKTAMSMMPMTPDPMTAYSPSTTASSYDPSSWEPSSAGGPYSRVWEPSASSSSSQSLAYSSYYPSSSSSGSSSLGGSSSSSGSSGSSSSLHSTYSA
ncbi:hypothetical protein HA402_002476 [Bradysia odoriphaga]|nr:hypothetical protein HA402_002476 [Bradysia odoriphaga]